MAASPYTVGFVYVMTNELMPGIVKVGQTSLLPEDRAADLYTTGVPLPFEVAYRIATSRPKALERAVHQYFHTQRVNHGREFFRVPVEEAIEAVRWAAIETSGIESWKSSERHSLRSGDRLALTLQAGQMFAVVAYPTVLSTRSEPIDFWQAHSDGDLLEIVVTDSASHVAGLSDGDPGGAEDPVPYLNRAKTVVNGLINGRELLVPGDRLVWVPAQQDAAVQASVVFEARDFCQVVSRTWSPQFGPEGFPLLLNLPTLTELWPAAHRSIQEALALPLPRSWSPRDKHASSYEDFGSPLPPLPPPEHWLPQLKPRARKVK